MPRRGKEREREKGRGKRQWAGRKRIDGDEGKTNERDRKRVRVAYGRRINRRETGIVVVRFLGQVVDARNMRPTTPRARVHTRSLPTRCEHRRASLAHMIARIYVDLETKRRQACMCTHIRTHGGTQHTHARDTRRGPGPLGVTASTEFIRASRK